MRITAFGAAASALAIAMTATATGTSSAATPTPRSKSSAVADCSTVLFLGARGSGQKGPGNPGWRPSTADPKGLGSEVQSLRLALARDLAGHSTLTVRSVKFLPLDVPKLAPGDPRFAGAWQDYLRNIQAGVRPAMNALRASHSACPTQQIVLAGYSQGAMVMHRILHELGTTPGGPAILARISHAALIADGDQVPGDNQVRIGSASRRALGVGQQWRTVSKTSNVKFPPLGDKVLSLCDKSDVVCDFRNWNVHGIYLHTHRYNNKPVVRALAQRMTGRLLAGTRDGNGARNPAGWILSPDGIGPFIVSMSAAAAVASGYAHVAAPGENCEPLVDLNGVYYDPRIGDTALLTEFRPASRLDGVLVKGRSFRTWGGLGVGSTRRQLEREYGKRLRTATLDLVVDVPRKVSAVYGPRGALVFALDSQGVVQSMTVIRGRPGDVLVNVFIGC